MSRALVDKHLRAFEIGQRQILNDLREMIAIELPTATEVIKYGIPTFMIEGVAIIGFDGYKKHNSIFPYSGSFNIRLEKELEKYEQTKGSIHFDLEKSIPKPLINKILLEKVDQINSSYPKKSGEFLEFYANGVLKTRGKYKADKLHGDWKWFRKSGVIMRSGTFKDGVQVGIWTTYDAKGKSYKQTQM